MFRGIKTLSAGLAIATVLSGSALAGGFSRGTANLDGLFGDGFQMYSGMTYVSPGRSYQNIMGTMGPSPDQTFTNDYYIPYLSVGGHLGGPLNCVASYTQPYGADSSYIGPLRFDTSAQSFTVDEYGATCSVGFDVGKGRAYFIGGAFYEALDYHQEQDFTGYINGGQAPGASTLDMSGEAWGYRIGIGYEIPEIALRGTLIYRSQTDFNASGAYANVPFAALTVADLVNNHNVDPGDAAVIANGMYGGNLTAGGSSSASLPQSLELNLRTGVAPGWLVFGQVKWTDWSVLKQIVVVEDIAMQEFSSTSFYFKDGWTVSGGVAHQFTDALAGSVALTWDKGVTSGYDTLSDTWTLSSGMRFSKDNVALNVGGGAIYFTEAAKTQGSYTATSPAEWGYALSISGSIKF